MKSSNYIPFYIFIFLIWPILEARAEILTIISLLFGKFKTPQFCSEIIWPLDMEEFPRKLTNNSLIVKSINSLHCERKFAIWNLHYSIQKSLNDWEILFSTYWEWLNAVILGKFQIQTMNIEILISRWY